MTARWLRLSLLAVTTLLLASAGCTLWRYARAAALVVRVSDTGGRAATIAAVFPTRPFTERDVIIPSRHGPLHGRWFVPRGTPRQRILLVPGLHAVGIAEPRLLSFARGLASFDVAVLALELPDFLRYQVTPRSTDMIEDAAVWASGADGPAGEGPLGLVGISFAGGLSVVAAGRPTLADRLSFVVSFGGHGDLPRVLHYLCTGTQPDGTSRPPHDYGVAIVLLNLVDHLVPPEQAAPLREAIRTFLQASHLDMVDKGRAQLAFGRARQLEATLPEPAATLMHYVNTRNVTALGPLLLPHIHVLGEAPSLSAERSPPPTMPVHLLHGAYDNVIPSGESESLAVYLRPRTSVYLLVTPIITHAEVERVGHLGDLWRLVAFWSRLLG